MEKDLLISIIVPVYNAEKYLERCVESILKQTYTTFEIILINDGSTDSSKAICENYSKQDDRIRIITKNNTGVADTRNIGLSVARGEYIAFVDSDDYIDENMLQRMIEKAVANDSDIVMCGYNIVSNGVIASAKMDYDESYANYQQIKDSLLYLYYTDKHVGLYSLCNKLIKKDVYLNEVVFDISLKRGEDAWFLFQCLKRCNRVDYISETYYYYCQNDVSIMHTLYEDQYEKWVSMRKRLLDENKDLKFDIDYALFYREFLYKVSTYCRDLAKIKKYDVIMDIINDEFYLNALNYSTGFPKHLQIIQGVTKRRWSRMVCLLYRIWTIKN